MTEYHNVDITIAAQNGTNKSEIKKEIKDKIQQKNNPYYNGNIEETVMVSKVDEVQK